MSAQKAELSLGELMAELLSTMDAALPIHPLVQGSTSHVSQCCLLCRLKLDGQQSVAVSVLAVHSQLGISRHTGGKRLVGFAVS